MIEPTKFKGYTHIFGIAPWKIVPGYSRHNTWHKSLYIESQKKGNEIKYLGLRNANVEEKWITGVFGNSILRANARISIRDLIKLTKEFKNCKGTKLVYIFEASISWLVTLTSFSLINKDTYILCNLFSSSKYQKIFTEKSTKSFFIIKFLKIHQKYLKSKILISFDTRAMSEWVNLNLKIPAMRFPVPGSFPQKVLRPPLNEHFKVLVNLRNYDLSNFHKFIEGSCAKCEFWIPRGSLDREIPRKTFEKYKNIKFEDQNPTAEEYENYFYKYDYSIFLYEPTIDASGRLFDSILAGLPVCVPKNAQEWSWIAKDHANHHLFELADFESIRELFMHPKFAPPNLETIPFFDPRICHNELLELANYKLKTNYSYKKSYRFIGISLYFIHTIFTLSSNIVLGLKIKTSRILKR